MSQWKSNIPEHNRNPIVNDSLENIELESPMQCQFFSSSFDFEFKDPLRKKVHSSAYIDSSQTNFMNLPALFSNRQSDSLGVMNLIIEMDLCQCATHHKNSFDSKKMHHKQSWKNLLVCIRTLQRELKFISSIISITRFSTAEKKNFELLFYGFCGWRSLL